MAQTAAGLKLLDAAKAVGHTYGAKVDAGTAGWLVLASDMLRAALVSMEQWRTQHPATATAIHRLYAQVLPAYVGTAETYFAAIELTCDLAEGR